MDVIIVSAYLTVFLYQKITHFSFEGYSSFFFIGMHNIYYTLLNVRLNFSW